jgi:hypothetical protein
MLNKRINFEREAACDEMVMNMQSNPLSYTKTLLKITEMSLNQKAQNMALGFSDNKSDLFKRIEILLGMDNKNQFKFNKLLTISTMIIMVFLLSAATYSSYHKKEVRAKIDEEQEVNIEVLVDEDGVQKHFKIKSGNGIIDTFPEELNHFFESNIDSMMGKMMLKFNDFDWNGNMQNIDSLLGGSFHFKSFGDENMIIDFDSLFASGPFKGMGFKGLNMDDADRFYFDTDKMDDMLQNFKGQNFNIDSSSIKIEIENGRIKLNGKEIDQSKLDDVMKGFNFDGMQNFQFNFPEGLMDMELYEHPLLDTNDVENHFYFPNNDERVLKTIKKKRLRKI